MKADNLVIAESGDIQFVAKRDCIRLGELRRGDKVLCALETVAAFSNPDPLGTVEELLERMKPRPAYVRDTADGPERCRAFYEFRRDSISVLRRERWTPDEIAEALLHEAVHCTGHPSRLARFHIAERDADPDEPTTRQAIAVEEVVADLGAFLVAVRHGLACRANLSPSHWIPNLAELGERGQALAIHQGQRAADYMLGL